MSLKGSVSQDRSAGETDNRRGDIAKREQDDRPNGNENRADHPDANADVDEFLHRQSLGVGSYLLSRQKSGVRRLPGQREGDGVLERQFPPQAPRGAEPLLAQRLANRRGGRLVSLPLSRGEIDTDTLA
jgi:hypothetical protein